MREAGNVTFSTLIFKYQLTNEISSKFGHCGFGPDFCASDVCVSGCDRKSDCDPGFGSQWAKSSTCPLNVCCSKFVSAFSHTMFFVPDMCASTDSISFRDFAEQRKTS